MAETKPQPRAIAWEPVEGINFPVYGVSFASAEASESGLCLRLHTGRYEPAQRDIEIAFANYWAMMVEDDMEVRHAFPKAHKLPAPHDIYFYPLLMIEHSPWTAGYARVHDWQHYAIVSLGKVVQVVATPDIACRWIEASTRISDDPAG